MSFLLSERGKKKVRLALLFACFLVASPAFAQEPEQSNPAPQDFVTETLPYPIDEVYERALLLFDSSKRDFYEDYSAKIYDLPEPVRNYKDLSPPAYRKFLALPLVRPHKFYVFYGAYPNMQSVLASITPLFAMGHANPALQRYALTPMSERNYDLYIWSPDTPYWYSEYLEGGKKLPFRSYFILHLSAIDADHTQVEIIEQEPVVRLNHQPSVDIHGIVHPYTLREVEPTTSDREFLLSCLDQFIDRHVPGRHWFNCREKGEVVEPPVKWTTP